MCQRGYTQVQRFENVFLSILRGGKSEGRTGNGSLCQMVRVCGGLWGGSEEIRSG